MSYREDFFRMLDGKTPVSDIPYYMIGVYSDEPSGYHGVMPSYNDFTTMSETGKNSWGVEYASDIFGTGMLPKPGQFMLTDVTKWRDIIKAPYRLDYDFKAAAEADLAAQAWDKETQVSNIFGLGGGYFLQLSGFMGFEGTMFAMYDQPDALHELLDYLCDYDCWFVDNVLAYYDVDVAGFGDDNATELNPFISYDMFKEFLLPRYKRVYDVAKKHGKIIAYHNCGRCEDFMDDMVAIGTQIWNCATPENDLNAFKAKHDNKVILEVLPRIYPGDSEENIRRIVRETIDEYAPGGAFVWIGSVGAMAADQRERADAIAYDEVAKYGKGFYAS